MFFQHKLIQKLKISKLNIFSVFCTIKNLKIHINTKNRQIILEKYSHAHYAWRFLYVKNHAIITWFRNNLSGVKTPFKVE